MKTFFRYLFLLTSMGAFAQPVSLKTVTSAIFKDEHKESYVLFAKDDSDGGCFIARSYKGGLLSSAEGYYLEHYDENMNLVKSLEYPQENTAHQKYKMLMGIVSQGTTISFIDIFYSVKEKAYQCIAHSANIKTGGFTDKVLFSIDRKELDAIGRISLSGLFYKGDNSINDGSPVAFLTTNEKDAFAVMLTIKGKDKKHFRIYSFDNNLDKVVEHTCVRNSGKEEFSFNNIEVTDNGKTVYLLAMANNAVNGKKETTCEITEITTAGERSGKFNNDRSAFENLKMFRKGTAVICAGFYIEPKSKWFNGVSYFEIDAASLSLKKIKHTAFPEDVKEDKTGSWLNWRYQKNLIFKDVVTTADDNIIINAEEYYEQTVQHAAAPGMAGGSSNTIYNYDNIISTKIDAEGNMVWVKDIEKSQRTYNTDDVWVSYTPVYLNGNMCFFINIDKDVKTDDKGEPEFRQRNKNKSNLTVVNVANDGTMSYEKLIDADNSIGPYMTARGIVVPNGVFFLGRKGQEKQMLKVSLQ